MKQSIDCFLACNTPTELESLVAHLRTNSDVKHVFLLVNEDIAKNQEPLNGCTFLVTETLTGTDLVMKIAEHTVSEYVLLCLKPQPLTLGSTALSRLLLVAGDSGAAMVYSDRYTMEHGERKAHPVIDYQDGSLRDDFDFGSLVLLNADAMRRWSEGQKETSRSWQFAGWYDVRLSMSRQGPVVHLNEFLYTEEEHDLRASGDFEDSGTMSDDDYLDEPEYDQEEEIMEEPKPEPRIHTSFYVPDDSEVHDDIHEITFNTSYR